VFSRASSGGEKKCSLMCMEEAREDAGTTEFPVLVVVLLAAVMGADVFISVVALVQETRKNAQMATTFMNTLKHLMSHMLRVLQHNLAFKDHLAQAKRATMNLPGDIVLTREHLGSCEPLDCS